MGAMTVTDEISSRMTGGGMLAPFWEARLDLMGRHFNEEVEPTFVPWMIIASPVEQEISTYQATKITPSHWESDFVPKTALGKRLLELRNKAVAAGMRLLSEDEILEEVRRRRGEIKDDEKNLY